MMARSCFSVMGVRRRVAASARVTGTSTRSWCHGLLHDLDYRTCFAVKETAERQDCRLLFLIWLAVPLEADENNVTWRDGQICAIGKAGARIFARALATMASTQRTRIAIWQAWTPARMHLPGSLA